MLARKYEDYYTVEDYKYWDGDWETKEALCKCGKYMQSEPLEGMPSQIRTEESLSKKKRHAKLWDGAKEALCGERGINESFD